MSDSAVSRALELARSNFKRTASFAAGGVATNTAYALDQEEKSLSKLLQDIDENDRETARRAYESERESLAAQNPDEHARIERHRIECLRSSSSSDSLPQTVLERRASDGNTWRNAGIVGAILLALFFWMFSGEGDSSEGSRQKSDDPELREIKMQRLVRSYVEANLRDPGSAQFRNQYGVCGEVNAKNAFGGYTGFRRFIASTKELVVFDGEALSGSDFQLAWDRVCVESPSGAPNRPR